MSDIKARLLTLANEHHVLAPVTMHESWCAETEEAMRNAIAEIEGLQTAIRVQANAVRMIDQKECAEYLATASLDSEREMNAILTAQVEARDAEIARLRVALAQDVVELRPDGGIAFHRADRRCDCGAVLTQCSSCAVGDWQAQHPECETCCPRAASRAGRVLTPEEPSR